MPTESNESAFEYLPEQSCTKHEFEAVLEAIDRDDAIAEDIGKEHVDCENGSCPISFGENSASAA